MYQKTGEKRWQGRIDDADGPLGDRWHQRIESIDLWNKSLPVCGEGEQGLCILGFCSDEGVRRNHGRTGAAEGPKALRSACRNFPDSLGDHTIMVDGGDVYCQNGDLESAQAELQQLIASVARNNYFPLILGGGHEVAYPHFLGVRNALDRKQNLGIINFDAHFDIRIPDKGPNSGTSFYQIAHWCRSEHMPFRYLCLGIQEQSNTQALFKRAEELDIEYILAEDLQGHCQGDIHQVIDAFLEHTDKIMVTICLDVFNQAYAPGVSAPNAMGLEPAIVRNLLRHLMGSKQVTSFDIAELNPSYDRDDATSRLAGSLLFEVVRQYVQTV